MTDDAVARAREYYRALDEHDYETLADLLAPEFVHDRPDMTLDGRDRFVRFMREERPQRDTTHRIDRTYGAEAGGRAAERPEVAVRGRLLTADGDLIAAFVDVFAVDDTGRVTRIDTYTQ